jgi:hypothetical protein
MISPGCSIRTTANFNTSKTQVMTIQDLFAKLSQPGQKRVSYGIWWAINKMNQCNPESYCQNFRHTFYKWISCHTAKYILPKLYDFTIDGRNYVNICNIDGDTVVVTYTTGMLNDNVRISIMVVDTKKAKEEKEEMERIEKENAMAEIQERETRTKIAETINYMYAQNKQTTKEEYMNVLSSKFDEKYTNELFKIFGWIK